MLPTLRTSLASFAALAGAATALGQEPLQFTIDQGASAWMWDGTTSLGDLQGNPTQNFELTGTMEVIVAATTHALGSGQVLSSVADVVPDLSGFIPNPLPFLPPLATIDVANLSLSFASDPFSVDAAGNWTTMITVTVLSGDLTVTPLVGTVTMTDLTGTVGDPTLVSGTLDQTGPVIRIVSPQNAMFDIVDMASGISATLTLIGTLAADHTCPDPASFCVTSPNSVGPGALMSHAGSTSLFANDLELLASGVPTQPGIFYYGPNQQQTAFGDGFRCVGGQVVRLSPTTPTGGVLMSPMVYAGSPVRSGSTWNFQAWYRDPAAGGAGFNLSDGLSISFCP